MFEQSIIILCLGIVASIDLDQGSSLYHRSFRIWHKQILLHICLREHNVAS
jgi:hypothetical protein